MKSIFVSIANYRDPELADTVQNLISTVSGNVKLRIAILSQCLQAERVDFPRELESGKIQIFQRLIEPHASRGVCWARSEIQKDYADEDYYLQLDSHVQLQPGWDQILLDDYAACAIERPAVLTVYLPEYRWENGIREILDPGPMHFRVEQKSWLPTARGVRGFPHPRPVRADFYSGHFAFAPGKFIKHVPYDPDIFFMGEEISMAIRAYSAGYDLFTPSKFIGAHNYHRSDRDHKPRALYWDVEDDAGREVAWNVRDQASKNKVGAICRGECEGLFGVQDQQRYAQFADRLSRLHGVELSRALPDGTEQRF